MRVWRLIPVLTLAAASVLLGVNAAGASFAQPTFKPPPGYHPVGARPGFCNGSNGGVIAPGVYGNMVVTGICSMPAGNVIILGNLTVTANGLLDAVTPGDPSSSPLLPAHVVIEGNAYVGPNGVLVLGCSPNISCGPMAGTAAPAISDDSIGGSLTAVNALGVVIHSTSIGGGVFINGGGGGAAGGAASGGCFTAPIPAPWSEDTALVNAGFPQYTDFEDNSIGGNFSITNMATCWIGSLRNQVAGSTTFVNDQSSDPDGMEVGNNLSGGNMTCYNDIPAVQFGDGGSAPNLVGGAGLGQCGFGVVAANPSPEAAEGTGIDEHIAVSTHSLYNSYGLRETTSEESTPPVTTEAGQELSLQQSTDTYVGFGLNGSVTGETVLTTNTNGITSFEDIDTCACTLYGQSGNTELRAYGTTLPDGTTFGTFLVIAGGTDPGGPSLGDFATLAGWGTFTSKGAPSGSLFLAEHLRIT